ncbi:MULTISPECIES: hypothetical protein [Thermomonospora]|uniref:Uncharacterized protein n=1 Tax=Thermomonospora cellulosilytica TaxID=1411118 RepID=A0A7W3MXJ3_9ACTN|nr:MULTISPECIES: hypothetical protein [Thermomonospora]MBA9003652.1 hypothetical protein [Thermomonospora cellulosilytica]
MSEPTLGQIVHYRGKQGAQAMRAALDSDEHVHLWVFTPGESGGFPEFNVPHGQADEGGDIPPGSWCWPPRV